MNWPSRRPFLEILNNRPIANSSLKKKLSLINRLRMLHQDNFPDLYACLKKEDLHKFHTEIINSLLSNKKILKHEDVHKVVQIIYLYSYDQNFISALLNELRVRGCDSWTNFAIWAETSYLVNKDVADVAKMAKCLDNENVLEGVYYLARYFENVDKEWLREVAKNVGEDVVKKKGEIVYQELRLSWNNEGDGKHVDIIKPCKNEFKWYQLGTKTTDRIVSANKNKANTLIGNKNTVNTSRKSINGDTNTTNSTNTGKKTISSTNTSDLVKMIGANMENIEFLEMLSEMIDGQSELVESVLKERKNRSVIPGLARVVAQLRHGQREIISRVLKNEAKLISENELVFIGELYKFGLIKISSIAELLTNYMASQDICRFCILFENVGRFMLLSQKGNAYGRRFVESLKNTGATGSDKMAVEACLGKIFKLTRLTVSLGDFLQWFFKKKNFVDGKLFDNLKKSHKFMLLCFMHPELFENENFLAEIVRKTGLENNIVELYVNTMPEILAISKNNLYCVASALGYLLEHRTDRRAILDRVLDNLQLPTLVRHKVVLELLDHCPSEIQEKYLQAIYEATTHIEIKSKIFNLCEKHGHNHLIENIEEDSFEIDMRSMCSD